MGQHGKSTGIHETTMFSPLSSQSESIHIIMCKHETMKN